LEFTFAYYTTAQQEEVVTQKVNELLAEFNFGSDTSDYDKIKRVYDWVCANVTYDYANLNNDNYTLKFSAYSALINRTSVCQGYALLVYRLLRESGVSVRVIAGTGGGGAHAWNIVSIDGLYYDVDSTWDAGMANYGYFLKSDENFTGHVREAQYSTDAFYVAYPMSEWDYTVREIGTWLIRYSGNGGTGAPTSQVKVLGEDAILSTTVPRKTYRVTYNANGGGTPSNASKNFSVVFTGWNTRASGDGISYSAGAVYDQNADLNLYAQWKNPTMGTMATISRTGYNFDGWYTSASGGTRITANSEIRRSQTLYAHWTPITYKVTYNANGGTGATSAQTKSYNVALTLSGTKPARTYTLTYNTGGGSVSSSRKTVSATFKNWNTKINGTGTSYNSGSRYTSNSAATLYAQWGNPTAGTLAEPTRFGYLFDGWYTAAKGGTKITSSTTISGNMTLYAHWTEGFADEVESFVAQLYKVCLNRNPDPAGLSAWTKVLKNRDSSGLEAAYGFIFSDEFRRKNLCNEDYIEQLYKAFLGRNADPSGRLAWINQLNRGITREEVFNGFALSQEFGELCKKYGIEQGIGIAVPRYGTVPTGNCSVCGKEDGVTGFVKRLYRVCLNREADSSGLSGWTGQLWSHQNSGRSVAYGFIFSQEFVSQNYSDSE